MLLDTHTFLWFIGGDSKLSSTARALIENPGNERLLSVASLWEMEIKASLGKLKLSLPVTELVERQIQGNAIDLLAIEPEHLDELAKLPSCHRDPFDRLLVAQSLAEDLPIVSKDPAFESYAVKLLWHNGAEHQV